MYVKERHLDDLLNTVFNKLLKSKNYVDTSRGQTLELNGVVLELSNPRARLSRTEIKGTIFSCLGEFIWYLSGSNKLDQISHYISKYNRFSDDGQVIYGGYGPRIFSKKGINQFENIVCLLKNYPSTRHAVIQLFDAEDLVEKHKDVPCTCTLQFLIRNSKLHLITHMRSNDAYIGLPHDVFAFTMFQEIISRRLGIELGSYRHLVGSLHIYTENKISIEQYLDEGWQSNIYMPSMPKGNPSHAIAELIACEAKIRHGEDLDIDSLDLLEYWKDLIKLLQIFKEDDCERIKELEGKIFNINVYRPYIQKRQAPLKAKMDEQLKLKFKK